ncbi:MAG: MBG domain-containing protein [Solirubrobacteraceae bacterium]
MRRAPARSPAALGTPALRLAGAVGRLQVFDFSSFTYTPAAGKVLGAGSRTLSVAFTPTDTTDYTSATATATINVTQATPTITWANPAAIVYGTALSGTQLDATASVPGTFTYTPAAGAVLGAGNNQSLSVSFTPTDTTDYTRATATATINVTQATPKISWTNPANIVYGKALSGTQLDATANVAGTFTYPTAAGTVLGAGNQALSVSFTPTDSTDYTTATASTTINVNQATLLITAKPATKVYGQQNPAFAVTYAGLTNGDSSSSLGGALHFSTVATASSPVNTYPLVPGGLTSPNYAITFVTGNLVVTPASLTITAKNQSRVYGQPNPPLTVASYQGFVNGDTSASLTAPVALSTTAVLDSFAGSYPIVVGGAASRNYAIRFVSGTLTITPPTDPMVLGRIAFVTSLYRDLLLRSPGAAELFSWLQQLNTGRSESYVASAIYWLRSHQFSFTVALQHAMKAQQLAIQKAR